MARRFQCPSALVGAITAVIVVVIMAGAFALTYDPVQPDGSIDNAPARALGAFVLGTPATLLFTFVAYLVVFNLHPPIRAVSRARTIWALGLAVAFAIFLAVSARDSFVHWYEPFYLVAMVPLVFAPLEAGFLAGSVIGQRHNKPLQPTRAAQPYGQREPSGSGPRG